MGSKGLHGAGTCPALSWLQLGGSPCPGQAWHPGMHLPPAALAPLCPATQRPQYKPPGSTHLEQGAVGPPLDAVLAAEALQDCEACGRGEGGVGG